MLVFTQMVSRQNSNTSCFYAVTDSVIYIAFLTISFVFFKKQNTFMIMIAASCCETVYQLPLLHPVGRKKRGGGMMNIMSEFSLHLC